MTITNKRYSYLRVAAIQIDVHPAGQNLTNMPHAFHARSTYDPRPYVSHMVYVYQPFIKSSITMDRATTPEKRGSRPNPQHDGWLIHGSVPSFFLRGNHGSSGGKVTHCWWQAIRLTGLIYQHAIGTFNTCSWGPIHQSLNDKGGGYNLGGTGSPHHTPWPS
jgi:hypothetical protein